ncbi:hypothetical protein EcWSU1_A030 (plasmid) [Enterobacter ludwigii]|uniref:Uncharacterized protein n=1 Tax=Enterobacter ludwigii TaxID=299767 RepID=G8LQA8_9ENTR|nr:hypothetical protein EcWSU1_A030 [Enterobacter ludwigii]
MKTYILNRFSHNIIGVFYNHHFFEFSIIIE